MRKTALLILANLFVFVVAAAFAGTPEAELEATVRQLDHDWLKARQEGDWETVERLTADDFQTVPDTGDILDRAAWFDWARNSTLKIDAKVLDVRTYLDGNAAVITLHAEGELTAKGETKKLKAKAVRLWMKEAGNWKLVSLHYSRDMK